MHIAWFPTRKKCASYSQPSRCTKTYKRFDGGVEHRKQNNSFYCPWLTRTPSTTICSQLYNLMQLKSTAYFLPMLCPKHFLHICWHVSRLYKSDHTSVLKGISKCISVSHDCSLHENIHCAAWAYSLLATHCTGSTS